MSEKPGAILFSFANVLAVLAMAQGPLPVNFTTAIDASGRATLSVQNLGATALTACAFIEDIHPSSGGQVLSETVQKHEFHDFLLDSSDPILPNQTRTFQVSNGSVTSAAAVWADGTSFGDGTLVQKILQRRHLARKHIELALSLLQDARRSGRSLSDTATAADIAEQQVAQDSNDPDVAPGLRMYYEQIKRRLAGPKLIHSSGMPFTDGETMDQAIRELEDYRQHLPL